MEFLWEIEFCEHEGDVDPLTRHVTDFRRTVAWFDGSFPSSFKTAKQVFLDLWLGYLDQLNLDGFFVKEEEGKKGKENEKNGSICEVHASFK